MIIGRDNLSGSREKTFPVEREHLMVFSRLAHEFGHFCMRKLRRLLAKEVNSLAASRTENFLNSRI